jgi:hypothetical protein
VINQIREAVRSIDSDLAITDVLTPGFSRGKLWRASTGTGVHRDLCVMAYSVARRTSEIALAWLWE